MITRVLIFILAVLVLAAPGAAAQDTLEFGLTAEAHDDFGDALEMLPHDHGVSDELLIEDSATLLWVADEPAAVDMEVEKQTVTVTIDVSIIDQSTDPGVTVHVGTFNDDGIASFEGFGTDDATLKNAGPAQDAFYQADVLVDKHEIQGDDGDYLAVQADFHGLTVQVEGSDLSAANYEEEGPPAAYPTPELATLAMTSFGLLGVVGATRFRGKDL